MAEVWIAEDPVLSRQVAVKILHRELAVDEDLRTRFRQEAIAAARLSHPGIVATYDTGDDDGTAYIVMQLIEGMTLRALLDERGSLPIDDAVGIAVQVADALSHAHDRGLVHRDVKPANVLVQPDGRVKVTDFGIAKAAGSKEALTRTGAVLGTARYLAPEQVNGGSIDGRTDVYALGLVTFEMLTGAVPFPADTDMAAAVARLTTEPPALNSQRADVPEALGAIVDRSIARDPADRIPSAAALRDALVAENPAAAPGTLTAARVAEAGSPGPRGPGPAPAHAHTTPVDPTEARVAVADNPPTQEQQRVVTPPRGGRAGRTVLLVALVIAALVGSFFAVQAIRDNDSGGGGGGNGGSETVTPIAIASVHAFDPPPGDGEEHANEVGFVTDGDAATAWETEGYNTPDFGGAKDGVGLVLTLDADAEVGTVLVNANEAGWSAQIFVSSADGGALGDWGAPVAQGENLDVDARFELSPATTGRYVLVWLTLLPPDGRLGINQIAVES
jgi:serine/threonine-protein kinase